jgi:hypothetical protein
VKKAWKPIAATLTAVVLLVAGLKSGGDLVGIALWITGTPWRFLFVVSLLALVAIGFVYYLEWLEGHFEAIREALKVEREIRASADKTNELQRGFLEERVKILEVKN